VRPLLTILLLFSLTLTYAQIRPITIPKTVKVDFGNQKKDKEYKKAVKDSLRSAKKRYKALQKQAKLSGDSDSSPTLLLKEKGVNSADSLKGQLKQVGEDSLRRLKQQYLPYDSSYLNQYKNQIPDVPDSTTIEDYKKQGINKGKKVIEQTPEVQQARQIQSEIGELPNNQEEAEALIESKANQYANQFQQELTKQQKLEQKYRKIIEEKRATVKAEKLQRRYEMMKAYADKDKLKQEAEQELKKVAKEELTKVADEQMSKAMTQLNKLKRKYGSFSSLDEIKNMKPYSLKDVPLKDRLDIGGSLQVVRGNPVSLDINPSITWWYNQRMAFGAGGTYRLKVGKTDDKLDVDSDVFGFRLYGQYKLGSWFAHLEFEDMNKQFPVDNSDQMQGEWVEGLLLGVGKYFNVYKGIKGNVVVMYNFLHEPLRSPYEHPVIVRVGFGF